MRRRLAQVLLLLWPLFARDLTAQTEEDRRSPGPGRLAVGYDLSNGQLDNTLPFDVAFDLAVTDKSRTIRAVAISLFESKHPFQVVSCGPASKPPCKEESWLCIAERGAAPTVFQEEWPKLPDSPPEDPRVDCSFTPNAAWLAPVLETEGNSPPPRVFYLSLPPLGATRHYQILFRFVEDTKTSPKVQAVLDEFRRKSPATIIDHFSTLNPKIDPPGAFDSASEKLLDALSTAARSQGLELIADPQDPLLEALGSAGGLSDPPAKEQLLQRLTHEGPGLLTDLGRVPIRVSECQREIQAMEAALEALKSDFQPNGAPAEITNGVQAPLDQLRQKDADVRIPFLARAQTPPENLTPQVPSPRDPCVDIDISVLQQARGFYQQLHTALNGLRDAARQRQPSLPEVQQRAQTAADAAFRLADLTRLIADARTRVQQTATNLAEDMADAAADAMAEAESQDRILFARASTIGTFESRQKWQIAGDFGFVYAPELGETAPHMGTNFYFRPVNKQAPLRWCPRGCFKSGWFQPGRRLSATIGVVLTDIGDGRTRDPLIETGKFSILVGGGLRLSDAVRLGSGGILFRERDRNPLIDDTSLVVSPYVSLSLDYDLQNLVQWFGRVFRLGGSGTQAASGTP